MYAFIESSLCADCHLLCGGSLIRIFHPRSRTVEVQRVDTELGWPKQAWVGICLSDDPKDDFNWVISLWVDPTIWGTPPEI